MSNPIDATDNILAELEELREVCERHRQYTEALENERDHYKALAEHHADRVMQQSVLIEELRAIVRHARNLVDTAKSVSPFDTLTKPVAGVNESFLEDLRAALASVREET